MDMNPGAFQSLKKNINTIVASTHDCHPGDMIGSWLKFSTDMDF